MNEQIMDALLDDVRHLLAEHGTREEKLAAICQLLQDKVEHYDWVGFYLGSCQKLNIPIRLA